MHKHRSGAQVWRRDGTLGCLRLLCFLSFSASPSQSIAPSTGPRELSLALGPCKRARVQIAAVSRCSARELHASKRAALPPRWRDVGSIQSIHCGCRGRLAGHVRRRTLGGTRLRGTCRPSRNFSPSPAAKASSRLFHHKAPRPSHQSSSTPAPAPLSASQSAAARLCTHTIMISSRLSRTVSCRKQPVRGPCANADTAVPAAGNLCCPSGARSADAVPLAVHARIC